VSEHAHSLDHGAVAVAQASEHGHPTAAKYIQMAVILGLITAFEVGVMYVHELKAVRPWILIALSAVKFALVAMFYMHLKFDHRLFGWFFVGGLALAASLILAFMTLFAVWTHQPTVQPGEHHAPTEPHG
jgi:cytochrome c oxidase subunit IV